MRDTNHKLKQVIESLSNRRTYLQDLRTNTDLHQLASSGPNYRKAPTVGVGAADLSVAHCNRKIT